MQKLIALLAILTTTFLFTSCNEDSTSPDPTDDPGNMFIESIPPGAEIWLGGTNTNNVTPDTLTNLSPISYEVTLKLENYSDTTFTVVVNSNQTASKTVTLTSNLFLNSFGPVRIFETAGTSVDEPSGLDLSSGIAYGISGSDNDKVDVYYSTDGTGGQGFLVQSADLSPSMTRVTKFRVGSGTDLNDGANSPLESSGMWTNNMSDREDNYVFLYDNDGNYSKVKIISFGGGLPGFPAWVEIQWWYNTSSNDVRF